jgi:very-short-patch-repair endonuclease
VEASAKPVVYNGRMSTDRRRRWRSSARVQERARNLRGALTPAEHRLWQHLRRGQLSRFGFRRQYPMGPFIVDFYCPGARLVVEVDGDVHVERVEYDTERTRWLEQQRRCRVLRFTNDEVLHNLDAVLEAIVRVLDRPPP